MTEQALRFRVGLFVLATLLLLAVLITLFGGVPTFLRRHDRYTVIFDDAPGVAQGTPVRRSGVRIGEVSSVQLDDATATVHVGLIIEKPHLVYRGDKVTLVYGLLSGDTNIDLVIARKDGVPVDLTPLEPNSVLIGASHTPIAALLNQAADMVPTAQESLNQIRATLQRIEKMTPLAEETLREYRDLARVTRESVPDLRRTNDELQNAARNWGRVGERIDVLLQTNQDKLLDRLTRTLDNLNESVLRISQLFSDENQKNLNVILKNVRTGSERFDSIITNTDELLKESQKTMRRVSESVSQAEEVMRNLQRATKPLADRGDSVMRNLDESSVRLNQTMTELRDLLRAVGQSDGTLRRFLDDPSLYNNLNEASCAITRLMPRIERILKDVEVFADKIARHPESLGLGGAINPSSGLKTVPPGGGLGPRH
jgi:phospholipid/cholesterol/gamma-HCH transport system substrate-binding protein